MKKIVLLLAAVGVMGLTGCTALTTSVQSSSIGIGTGANFQADLNVADKISGTCTINQWFGFFYTGDTDKEATGVMFDANQAPSANDFFGIMAQEAAKSNVVSKCARAAAYNAVVKNGADVIFAPRYTSEVSGFPGFKTINVNLTGYKATIKGFKQLDQQKILEGIRH